MIRDVNAGSHSFSQEIFPENRDLSQVLDRRDPSSGSRGDSGIPDVVGEPKRAKAAIPPMCEVKPGGLFL